MATPICLLGSPNFSGGDRGRCGSRLTWTRHQMASGSFRTTLFLAALSTAVIALAVAGLLFARSMRRQVDERIEQTLIAEARLASDLLSQRPALPTGAPGAALADEADRMGRLLDARVTLIAPDGRVVGDSSETADRIAAMENHA